MNFRTLPYRLPRWSATVWGVVAFLVLIVAVSPDSLEMEEAQTWEYARLDSVDAVWSTLSEDPRSTAQMPLAMLAQWGWARWAGTSEFGLRSINILWAALAIGVLVVVARAISISWLPMFFAIQPFAWYAMNEARPWMMQMAGGVLLLAGTVWAVQKSKFDLGNLAAICGGSVLLAGGNMLGLLPVASVFTGLIIQGIWRHLPGNWAAKMLLAVTGVTLGSLCFYYAATVLRGAGGSTIWAVTPLNVAFVAYEFLGLQGLGPGRQTLRAIFKGLESPAPIFYALPGLLLLIGCHFAVLAAAFKSWLTRECHTPRPSMERLRIWMMCVGVCLQSALLMYLVGSLMALPFWGRHLVGAFPFFVTGLALVIQFAHQGLWRKFGRAASALLVVLLLTGSLLMRFSPVQAKDDYRSAAAQARQLAGANRSVLWCADESAARYYGVPFSPLLRPGGIVPAANIEPALSLPPDVVILSKPDTFDYTRAVRSLVDRHPYREVKAFRAFRILELKKPLPEAN